MKNSDQILAMKKTKAENAVAIKMLDAKIDNINKELEIKDKEIKDSEETANLRVKFNKSLNAIECKLCDKSFRK